MKTNNDNLESLNLNIEQLLAEADELIKMINSDAIKNMKEEHLIEFEKCAQNLEKIKYEARNGIEKIGTGETESVASGAHEAIQDILKAMRDMTKYLS